MAQVVVELSGDEKKLLQAYQRIRAAQDKMDAGLKQTKAAHNATFGQAAVGQLAGYAASFVGISQGINTVLGHMRAIRMENERLAASQRQAKVGLATLAQLAETPEQFRQLVGQARQTFAEGGAPTLDAAGALQFALTSAGLDRYREAVSALQSSGVVTDAKSLVDAGAALEAAMGTRETGDFRAIVSKAFGASKGAPASAEAILLAASQSGAQAAALGMTDEQLLAATATVAKVTGSAEAAGTQVQSLLKQIEKEGIGRGRLKAGQSLTEQVGAIQALVDAGTNVRSVLGNRQEAITAFRTLSSNMTAFQENIRNVEEAVKSSPLGPDAFARKISFAESVLPELSAVNLQAKTAAGAELAATPVATWKNLAEAVQEDIVRQMIEAGGGTGWAITERAIQSTLQTVLGPRGYVERMQADVSPEVRASILQAAEQLRAAAGELRESASTANRQRAAVAGVAE